MTQSWSQIIYGKYVTKPNGPIRKGEEHKITGRTGGLDRELEMSATPDQTGIGSSDTIDWDGLRWNAEGGAMVSRVLYDRMPPMLLTGKIRGRAESREGGFGRKYTQAHYAVLPIDAYEFAPTMGLFQALKADPQVLEESSDVVSDNIRTLPPLDVDNPCVDLPDDWLSLIQPILKVILSGLHLSINTNHRTMEEMVNVVHIIQSALPHSLAWRLTTKIGAFECPPDEAVLSFVQKLKYGMPRMVGFRLNDHQKNTEKLVGIDNAERHPFISDALLGERYIQYLATHCADCQNTHALQTQTASDFRDFQTWNYFDPQWSFQQTAVEFMKVLFEDDGLSQLRSALNNDGEFPPLSVFYYRKKEALLMLLENFWEHPSFVLQTLESWADTWEELYPTVTSDIQHAMQLMMPSKPIDIATLDLLTNDIPMGYQAIIQQSITQLLRQLGAQHEALLIHFLEQIDTYPTWIQSIFQHHEPTLVLKRRYLFGQKTPTEALPNSLWFQTLSFDGLVSAIQSTHPLIQAVLESSPTIQRAFIEEVFPTGPLFIMHWLTEDVFASLDFPLVKKIRNWTPQLETQWRDQWPTLLHNFQNLHCHPQYANALFVRLLLDNFRTLNSDLQDQLWPILQPQVGSVLARWVFQRPSSISNGAFDHLLLPQLTPAYQAAAPSLQSFFEDIQALPSDFVLTSEVLDIGKCLLSQRLATRTPLERFLVKLKHNDAIEDVPDMHAEHLQFWLTALDKTLHLKDIQDNEAFCHLYLRTRPAIQSPTPRLLTQLLNAPQGSERLTAWQHTLQQIEWDSQPIWHWLFRDINTAKPLQAIEHSEELRLITRLSFIDRLHLLQRGILLPSHTLAEITREHFQTLNKPQQNVLVWWATQCLTDEMNESTTDTSSQSIQESDSPVQSLQRTITRGWIAANLSTTEQSILKDSIVGMSGLFASLTQQVTDYFEQAPTHLPTEWTPLEWVREFLLQQPSAMRFAYFPH